MTWMSPRTSAACERMSAIPNSVPPRVACCRCQATAIVGDGDADRVGAREHLEDESFRGRVLQRVLDCELGDPEGRALDLAGWPFDSGLIIDR